MNVIDYDRKMRVDVRDSSGPKRTVLLVNPQSEATYLTFDCGHVGSFAQHFSYKTGEAMSCFSCRFAADNVIGEEAL